MTTAGRLRWRRSAGPDGSPSRTARKLIARAALCLVAIGNSFGALSEAPFGRQFGKLVVGLEVAARVEGVVHVADEQRRLREIALVALAVGDQTF